MKLYRSHGNKRMLKYQGFHIINPETLKAFCGDDPQADPSEDGKHFEGIAGDDLPKGERFCRECVHAKSGYKVENIQYGQVRRYGPSVYKWHVTDLTGERPAEEVKAYCRTHVRQVPGKKDPDYHPLNEHYQGFGLVSGHTYYYQTGCEWNG